MVWLPLTDTADRYRYDTRTFATPAQRLMVGCGGRLWWSVVVVGDAAMGAGLRGADDHVCAVETKYARLQTG